MIDLAERARAEQVPVTAMCSGHRGWFIDPDPAQVQACIDDVKRLLELGSDLDAPLIVVPIYGRTRHLPPHCGTGRTAEEDEQLWLEGLGEVTAHADRVGGKLLVEAINRYQNSVSVTVDDAVRWARAAGSPNVAAMADTFHMNIEEARIGVSLERAVPDLGYVHLSDSNRLEPGTGHIDFVEVFAALSSYDGWASLECNWSTDDVAGILSRTVRFLRTAIAAAGNP